MMTLSPGNGICSSLSSSYSGLCSYTSTSTTSSLDFPFLKQGTTNFVLTPSPLSLTTIFPFVGLNSNPNNYLIIRIFEPSGNEVEIVKVY